MTLLGLKKRIWIFLVNYVYAGTNHFDKKITLMRKLGHKVGNGTKIVGPVFCTGKLNIGDNCWIGKNLIVNGNGIVTIGNNCDIAPEVIFQTGGHEIGGTGRRAGKGIRYNVNVGNGCWIGARSTILGGVTIEDSCVVAACACVCKNIDKNSLVGGVPARLIRKLEE